MSKSSKLIEAEAQFYAWKPPGNCERGFRCHHISSKPRMTEDMCEARAKKPEIFRDDCGGKCPRWKHYRKLFKKSHKKAQDEPIRRAYR